MWRSRPIFISSTFADMQAERDYLRTRVFPELEERLRSRRYNLEWVDLRVGVATASQSEEHMRELHVLKVCLDEVRRCRPFLIVLLGDRYGWVPPEDRSKAAAEEAREGFSGDVAGRSVTDLEIEFGVLSDPEQQPRSFFYFREPLPYAEMPEEIAAVYCEDYAADAAKAERKERLAALKRRIETRLPGRMVPYHVAWDNERQRVTGLEDFGRMVLDDLWSELEAETGTSATAVDIPWQQAEREALEDFIDDRARDFVGRQSILEPLIGLAIAAEAEGAIWGACVTGDPGSGKSALFGELYRCLQGRDAFLLAHAAGASINASSVDSMLRRWIDELAEALGTDPGLAENADPSGVEATFARLLGQMAQQRRVVVLVDALDQFEATTRAQFVTWLQRLWPANARFIATAIAGKASQALDERAGVELLQLAPLDASEARGIIEGICRRYHRTFEPDVIEALLAKGAAQGPTWSNPLWLVLAVEDLNLLDADDFARAQRLYAGSSSERLRALMLDIIASISTDIPGLYAHTFARAEGLFGANVVWGFLGLIAVSRAGWRESDFRILLPRASGENWDGLKFAQLRRLFRGQMRQRGALAQWDFNHSQMRVAVRTHLDQWGLLEQKLHTVIADRLLSCLPDDPLHISETTVHLLASKDYDRTARYYGDPSLTEAEVQGATRVLADAICGPAWQAARDVCKLLDVSDNSICAMVAERFLFDVGDALEETSSLGGRLTVFEFTIQTFKRLLESNHGNLNWQRDLSACYDKIGDVMQAQGNLPGALLSFFDCVAIRKRLTREDPANDDGLADLSASYSKVADVLQLQGNLSDALQFFRDSVAIRERLARTHGDNTDYQRDVSAGYLHFGDVLLAQGNLPEALHYFRRAHAFAGRLAQADPHNDGLQRDLAVSYGRVGDALLAQSNLPEALQSFREAHAVTDRLAQADPGNTGRQRDLAVSYGRVGDVLFAQGNLPEASQSFDDAQAIALRLALADNKNATYQHILAAQYERLGRVSRAKAQTDPGNAGLAQGNLPEASQSFDDARAIALRLAKDKTYQHILARQYERLGRASAVKGNLNRLFALRYFCECIEIRERLVRGDPSNSGWQRDLAESHAERAMLLKELGDTEAALRELRAGRDVMTQVTSLVPTDDKMQGDLAWFDREIDRLWMLAPTSAKSYYRLSVFYEPTLRAVLPGWYMLRRISFVGMWLSGLVFLFVVRTPSVIAPELCFLVFAILAIVSHRRLTRDPLALIITEKLSEQWTDQQQTGQAVREQKIEIERLKSIYRDRYHPAGLPYSGYGTMSGSRGGESPTGD